MSGAKSAIHDLKCHPWMKNKPILRLTLHPWMLSDIVSGNSLHPWMSHAAFNDQMSMLNPDATLVGALFRDLRVRVELRQWSYSWYEDRRFDT